jgi:hypothetical protein
MTSDAMAFLMTDPMTIVTRSGVPPFHRNVRR